MEKSPGERSILQLRNLVSRVEQVVISIPGGKGVTGYRDESVGRNLNRRTDLISLRSGLCRSSPIEVAGYAVTGRKAKAGDDSDVWVGDWE